MPNKFEIELEEFKKSKIKVSEQQKENSQNKNGMLSQKIKNAIYIIFELLFYVFMAVMGYFSYKFGLFPPYLIILTIIFMFWSLKPGTRDKNKASAYSVFNKGFKRLHGTFSEKHVDGMIKNKIN